MLHSATEAAVRLVQDLAPSGSSTPGGACPLQGLVSALFCSLPRLRPAELHAALQDIMRWQGTASASDAAVISLADQFRSDTKLWCLHKQAGEHLCAFALLPMQ